jgi:hypothetical protein
MTKTVDIGGGIKVQVVEGESLLMKRQKYTHDELKAAFEKVENKENWKLPIRGIIEESEFQLVYEAAIYFAGSPLESRKLADGRLEVSGAGYYNCIGA